MLKSNTNKILAFICLVLIAFAVYTFLFKASSGKETLQAHAGLLDLSGKDFSKDSAVYLGGEWAFYYNKFINPLDKETKADGYIQVPKLWNSFQYNGKSIGSEGYGSYRLKVILAKKEDILALKLPSMSSCYKLYINGTLVNDNGKPAASKELELPQWKPEIAFFAPDSKELDIIVHISNFHHVKGGMWGNILMGNNEDIVRYRDLNLMRSYLLFGILAIAAIFMLALSMIERNYPCLSLGLFCLCSALREICVREVAIWNLVSHVSFDFLARLEYVTMPLGILFFTMFIYNLHKNEFHKKVYFTIRLFSYLLIILTLATPPRIFSMFLNAYMLEALVAFVCAVFVILKSFLKGHSSSGVSLIGVIVLLLAAINDTLYMGKINNNYSAAHTYSIAFSIFLLCQIYIVFESISENYKKARKSIEAQLMLLQSQIRPHFLYNVLNSVQNLIDEDPPKAKTLIREFAEYLRGKFKYSFSDNEGFISIKDELDLLNSYIYMSNSRFNDKIALILDVDDCCLDCLIPAFFIQPIVENSIIHGFGGEEIQILVSVKKADENIMIRVRDNGVGMSRIELYNLFENKNAVDKEAGRNGVGLRNIRMRMQLYYNRDIEIQSEKGSGTEVTLTLPLDLMLSREDVKC